jgi:hypothetical protein
MLDAVARQSLEANLRDDVGETDKARPHVRRQRTDLGIHNRIERLDHPPHDSTISQKSDIVHTFARSPDAAQRAAVIARLDRAT